MYIRSQVETEFRRCVSITAEVNRLVKESGVQEGYCMIRLLGHTAGLGITSFWDKRGLDDLQDELDKNVPARVNYKNQVSPYNAAGYVKSTLTGREEMLLIHNGNVVLGSSQGIVIMEFDGPGVQEYEIIIEEKKLLLVSYTLDTDYMGMIELTESIQATIRKSGIKTGICHISQLHSTAGLLLCAESSKARKNIMLDIENMVPTRADFKHRETASDAGGHVKTAITDSQLSMIIIDGKMVIGEDQSVVFAEYDGPRPRSYYVGILYDDTEEERMHV